MRAFVAVLPPPESLAALAAAVASLRDANPGLSWVPPERMHVTLAFLGDIADETASRVVDGLADAVRGTTPFALRIERGGAFPRPARANVLWAGLAGDLDALSSLARVTRRVARGARVEIERTPYRPHVTVARVRRRGLDGGPLVAALDAVRGEPWTVTETVLMRSHLGPKPSYDVVGRAPFSARP